MSEIEHRLRQQQQSSMPVAVLSSSSPPPPPSSSSPSSASTPILHPTVSSSKSTVVLPPISIPPPSPKSAFRVNSSSPSASNSVASNPDSPSSSDVEIYDIDAGIIRCICGFADDDGFTIQCEKCHVWQHAVCVNITDNNQVPDVYLCDRCGRHSYDVVAARQLQARRLETVRLSNSTLSDLKCKFVYSFFRENLDI